jgi:site-specific DNA-methyltransferase (cytosine-N4-specific)
MKQAEFSDSELNEKKLSSPWLIDGLEPYYTTEFGAAYLGNALDVMKNLSSNTVDLIMTSPPFALQRKKEYGNKEPSEYVEWFIPFAVEFKRILKPRGSLVIHIGGSWEKGKPVKNLYQYELLVRLCTELNYNLAQDLYWFNKAKLPGPAQWVTVNRWRLKDAVDQIFWLSKTPYPKADNRRVLKEYSDAMKQLLSDRNYYKPNVLRPSEHRISDKFYNGNRGAIHPNIFQYSNTESQSKYIRLCREYGIKPNPARYPVALPEFFISFLTNRGNKVLDPFAGSNATGEAAEKMERKWISIEKEPKYVQGSMFRFFDETILETKYGIQKQQHVISKDSQSDSASSI